MQNQSFGLVARIEHLGRVEIVPDVQRILFWDGMPPERTKAILVTMTGEIELDRRHIRAVYLVSPVTGKTVERIGALAPEVEPA